MKKKPQNFWTEEEIALLTDLYPATPNEELARRFCRSLSSITGKAYGLGLQSKQNIKSKTAHFHLRKVKKGSEWAEADTKLLFELFPDTPDKVIAERLGKTVLQVKSKARYHKLVKSPDYKPVRSYSLLQPFRHSNEKIEQIKALYPVTLNKTIAKEVGCGKDFVVRVAKIFNLKRTEQYFEQLRNSQAGNKRGSKFKSGYKTGGIIRHHGYLKIYVGGGRYDHLHIYNWRKHHGEIPTKHFVTFKDGNRDNCDISNLELVSCGDLHQRKRESHLPKNLRPLFRFTWGLKRAIAVRKKAAARNGETHNNQPRFWTPEKIEKLKSLYGSTAKKAIAEIFGCTTRTVYSQAAKLGLYATCKRIGNEKFWTDEKIERLKTLFGSTSTRRLAEIFECDYQAIYYQAAKLNLKKDADFTRGGYSIVSRNPRQSDLAWTEDKNNQLIQLYPSVVNSELAVLLGTTKASVRYQAKKLKLRKPAGFSSRLNTARFDKRSKYGWTDEKNQLLKELYPTKAVRELTAVLGTTSRIIDRQAQHLELKKDPSFRMEVNRKTVTGNSNYYVEFRNLYKDIAARNGLSVNGYDIRLKDGYFVVKTEEARNYERLHHFIWIQNHGEIPAKHLVVFKDRNPLNCCLENLELTTMSEYKWRLQIESYPSELQPTVAALVELKKAIKAAPRKSRRYTVEKTHAIWSDEELSFLKTNYTRLNNAQLAAELNRHPDAIAAKKTRLGLRVRDNGGGRRKKGAEIWTPERVERLKEIYPSRLARELAKEFGCSAATIVSKAQKLGISKGRGRRGSGTYKKYSIGDERTHVRYASVEVKTENGWKSKANVIWEKENGNVPKGGYIAFKDGNRFNFDISNLQLRSHAELSRQKLGIGTPDCLIDAMTGLDLFKIAITNHPDYVAPKKGVAPRSWSNEELNYLRQSHSLAKRSEIAKKLGRSVRAVSDKARKMRLKSKTERPQQVHI